MAQKTYFIDIDGCLIYHDNSDFLQGMRFPSVLAGVPNKLLDLHSQGHTIILTTGRPSTMRERLVDDLNHFGIFYDQLITDCGSGVRVLVNDIDPKNALVMKAEAVNLLRNSGINDI